MSKKKTVCDEQLAEEIKKLLEQSDVDDTVITEVVAKINDGDKVVDADGQEVEGVDLDTDDEEEIEDDDDVVEEEEDEEIVEDPDDEIEDDDDELDFEEFEEDEDDIEDEDLDEDDDDLLDDEEDDIEDEDLDEDDEDLMDYEDEEDDDVEDDDLEEDLDMPEENDAEYDDEEEVEDEEPGDPFAKLKDPAFADAFNRGYAFAIGLMKMGKLPETDATDGADEEEELEPSKVTPEEEQEEAKKKVIAQDSIKEIKESLAKEMAQQFNAKLQAKDKVKSLVGEVRDVMAFDSANDIYKFALEQNGVNVRKYKPSAYEGMVDMMLEKRSNIDIPVVIKDANPFEGCSDSLNQAIARLKKINSK